MVRRRTASGGLMSGFRFDLTAVQSPSVRLRWSLLKVLEKDENLDVGSGTSFYFAFKPHVFAGFLCLMQRGSNVVAAAFNARSQRINIHDYLTCNSKFDGNVHRDFVGHQKNILYRGIERDNNAARFRAFRTRLSFPRRILLTDSRVRRCKQQQGYCSTYA